MGLRFVFLSHFSSPLPFGEGEPDARRIRWKAMLLTEIMGRAASGYDTFLCADAGMAGAMFERQVLLVKATAYSEICLARVAVSEEAAERADALLIAGGEACARECARRWGKETVWLDPYTLENGAV